MEQIFVLGYPKSGNTWLSKLITQAVGGKIREDNVVHSEFNDRNEFGSANYQLVKMHYLPKDFYENEAPEPKRIVYIYRGVRDVAISSFFYWNKIEDVGFKVEEEISSVFKKTKNFRTFVNHRRKLLKYTAKFCTEGPFNENPYGLWDEHIRTWKDEFKKLSDTHVSIVNYEQLLEDTQGTLKRVLKELRLEKETVGNLGAVIEKESFSKLKKHFTKSGDDVNKKFLRTGKAGDWLNYFTRDMGLLIHGAFFKTMEELEYEKDNSWFEALPTTKYEYTLMDKVKLRFLDVVI